MSDVQKQETAQSAVVVVQYRDERDILWDAVLCAKLHLIKGRIAEAKGVLTEGLDRRAYVGAYGDGALSEREETAAGLAPSTATASRASRSESALRLTPTTPTFGRLLHLLSTFVGRVRGRRQR